MTQTKITDKSLCAALYRKDLKAFDTIYERYWKRLYVYAYKIFEDQLVCEDLVQEVFVDLWGRAAEKRIEHLEAYLFRAVKFQVLKVIRNLKKTTDLEAVFAHLPEQLMADHLLEFEEVDRILKESILALPDKCKEVFQLSREADMSNLEISRQMNISVRTVEAHLYKALKSIKKNISQIYFGILGFFVDFISILF
ncbi:RNA polymerase sigma-70 factor [Cyclobacterium jeungdonense]|uniref:RNA polymerase sigma-70 factor n=1 Tax=Cyclobacterium jeungdonense TaxID=708087 RepID=A0ABT8CAK9_9BACT|nr:RNA polymerase sigma-70 factor [Cyclobacterium jeungdonense]MDN3689839.1 RNA polymerase sigma-70 factor [Cyclobacterium jeungdonense]